jgi:hypothetical protein
MPILLHKEMRGKIVSINQLKLINIYDARKNHRKNNIPNDGKNKVSEGF